MATRWIIAADESRARVLQVTGQREQLAEIDHLSLRKELGKEVEKLVADELPKDLSWFSERDLERYFSKESGRAP